jgi:hypothetical protein
MTPRPVGRDGNRDRTRPAAAGDSGGEAAPDPAADLIVRRGPAAARWWQLRRAKCVVAQS